MTRAWVSKTPGTRVPYVRSSRRERALGIYRLPVVQAIVGLSECKNRGILPVHKDWLSS